ncbi:MAG TPA: DUF2269 family protein [Acidimicrobiia bacterium]|nr:DUF2269 family protein [Acidimicrobiia bacterium]
MLIADYMDGAYKVTKVLHLLAVMAGLGVTFWYGVYGMRAKKAGESGDAMGSAGIAEANDFVGRLAEKVIYTIPVLGVGLVFMSGDVLEFSQTWVWLALVLFAVGLTNATVVLMPSARKIAELSRELASMGPPPAGAQGPPPQVAAMDVLGKKLGMFSGVNHILVVVILYLMVAKPGL